MSARNGFTEVFTWQRHTSQAHAHLKWTTLEFTQITLPLDSPWLRRMLSLKMDSWTTTLAEYPTMHPLILPPRDSIYTPSHMLHGLAMHSTQLPQLLLKLRRLITSHKTLHQPLSLPLFKWSSSLSCSSYCKTTKTRDISMHWEMLHSCQSSFQSLFTLW